MQENFGGPKYEITRKLTCYLFYDFVHRQISKVYPEIRVADLAQPCVDLKLRKVRNSSLRCVENAQSEQLEFTHF